MRIAQAARLLDVSASWLRELERRGVVPPVPRDLNGDRRYSESDVARLRAVILGSASPTPPE